MRYLGAMIDVKTFGGSEIASQDGRRDVGGESKPGIFATRR
jgi:hypothetical protein